MQTLLENTLISIHYDEDKLLLQAIWKDESKDMHEEEFKEINLLYLEYLGQYEVKGFIIDTCKFLFVISLDLQAWVAENIIQQLASAGLKKLAMLTSEEFISQISIEQTMEEVPELRFSLAYFSDMEEAAQWVLES